MPTPEKTQAIEEIEARFKSSTAAVLADFRGLNVGQVMKLRRSLREAGIEYRVYKNTLIKIAADRAGVSGLDPYLEGPTAIAFSGQDPVAPAKILAGFAKESRILKVKCGVLKGETIDSDQVARLAALPSREVLLAQIVGSMKSPITGLVNVLAGPARKLVWALDAVRAQKEEAAGGAIAVEAE